MVNHALASGIRDALKVKRYDHVFDATLLIAGFRIITYC